MLSLSADKLTQQIIVGEIDGVILVVQPDRGQVQAAQHVLGLGLGEKSKRFIQPQTIKSMKMRSDGTTTLTVALLG